MYSISESYFGPVSRALGDGSYSIRSFGDGDYISLKAGCWVLGKITGEKAVEFFPISVTDPHRSNQALVLILGDQLNLRDRLRTGRISFNDAYFQALKRQLGEKKQLLTEDRTKLSHITPQEADRQQLIAAYIWLGTGSDSALWQRPEQPSYEELSRQIASLDTVIARL